MKKILSIVLSAGLCVSLFAADIFTYAPMKGNVKSYTKTDFTIASKFGNYFRTPSAKFNHVLDENGKEIESTELTAKNVAVNTIKSSYDSLGNLKSQVCSTPEGEILWKSEIAYKNNMKSEVSEFNANNELKSKTIYSYSFDKLTDESSYNSDGALVWKTVYTYTSDGVLDAVSEYFPTGALSEESKYEYAEDGTIKSITHIESTNKEPLQEVFRYDDKGLLTEITTYDESKQITKRVLFKYDSKDNIAKVTTYNVAQKFGGIVQELADMTDYSFEYNGSDIDSDNDTVIVISEK